MAFSAICPLIGREAHASDFHRDLAAHWAPDIWQDTWYYPEADYITAFDGDGDWIGANNLESLEAGLFEPYNAYIYCVVFETETHFLIVYEIFHPFDYDHPWMKRTPGAFHENDTEGVMVVASKDPAERFGIFRLMETRPHGYTCYYTDDRRARTRKPRLIERPSFRGSHPEIYVQRGGHGPYGLHAWAGGLTVRHGFIGDIGVVYRYKGAAESPDGPNDRDVGYDLIHVDDPRGLWTHRCDRDAFDNYRPYTPPPGRPDILPSLLCDDGTIPRSIDGDTSGDSGGTDSAGVPWRHYGLDPAWEINRDWRLPEDFSTDYVLNPFLGIGRLE